MKKIIQIILLMCSLSPLYGYAQNIVSGIVRDSQGVLPGVSISEKGETGNGTLTDENGAFRITLKGISNTIILSNIGYISKEINVSQQKSLNVLLEVDSKNLEEVMVVGYGTTKKITNTGAVSTVSATDIRETPTPNIQNTLAGRVPGFFAQQRSGQPGHTGSDFFIRGVNSLNSAGQAPLIIVDDVEYSADQVAQLDANEIESFSILKDASTTAIYGVKGANGVLVITTRRGKIGKPRINFTTESGLQLPFQRYTYLNSFQVASLRNEALRNDGKPEDFSEESLEHFRLGDDPYGHPDVDWYNEIYNKSSYQTRNNFDISGGTERIKYFVSAGYLFQNGMLKNFSIGSGEPDNNYAYQRYNFRSNLDMQATSNLKLRLDVTGRIGTIKEPHISTQPLSVVNSYQRLPPYASPLMNPDGSFPYAKNSRYEETSLIGRLALQGYDRTYRNELNILLGGTHKLDFLTQGLSLNGHVTLSGDITYARSLYRNNIPAFYYDPVAKTYTLHSNALYRLEPLTRSGNAVDSRSRKTTNSQGRIDYDRTFGEHRVFGLALYSLTQYINTRNDGGLKEDAPTAFRGYAFRAGYDYKQRYMFEFNAAYNGSDRFVEQYQNGFFPALSAGWNIAEEPFFKNAGFAKYIDMLKLRGSWGLSGSDIVKGDSYKYEQIYSIGASGTNYSFGESHNTFTTIEEGQLGNENITWEKSKKTNIGIDLQMFSGKLSVTADYFYDLRYDQLYERKEVLNIIGVTLPVVNMARTENRGWDGQISYNNTRGDFRYSAGFTFSFAKNKILYIEEAAPRFPWLAQTGQPIGRGMGYNVLGFFQTLEEVDNYATLNSEVKPGDLKYEDLNDDGIIDQFDMRYIGKPNLPQTVLGTTLGLSYKGLSINMLIQGSFNYSFRVSSATVIPFQANLQPIHLTRWTPDTKETAKFPRLSENLAGPSSPNT
jgi:TonB-linked SusC/RagA family outer membrane protein